VRDYLENNSLSVPDLNPRLLNNPKSPNEFGLFIDFLVKFVKDEKILTLEDAIRRITSLPAGEFQLQSRGLLAPGYHADIVIFALDELTYKRDFLNPIQKPAGVKYVLVNGEICVEDGKLTGHRSGQVLKPGNL